MRKKNQQSQRRRQKSWFYNGFISKFISLVRKSVKEYSLGKYGMMLLKQRKSLYQEKGKCICC